MAGSGKKKVASSGKKKVPAPTGNNAGTAAQAWEHGKSVKCAKDESNQ